MTAVFKRLRAMRRPDDAGQSTTLYVVLVAALIVVAGLVVDGGAYMQAKDRSTHVAQEAARAGANAVSGSTVLGAPLPQVNAVQAETKAQEYISAAGMEGSVRVEGDLVTVEVTDKRRTTFLGIVGISSVSATSQESARLVNRDPAAPAS